MYIGGSVHKTVIYECLTNTYIMWYGDSFAHRYVTVSANYTYYTYYCKISREDSLCLSSFLLNLEKKCGDG